MVLFVNAKKCSTNKQPRLLYIGSKDEPGHFYLILGAKTGSVGDCGTLRAVDSLFKVQMFGLFHRVLAQNRTQN